MPVKFSILWGTTLSRKSPLQKLGSSLLSKILLYVLALSFPLSESKEPSPDHRSYSGYMAYIEQKVLTEIHSVATLLGTPVQSREVRMP